MLGLSWATALLVVGTLPGSGVLVELVEVEYWWSTARLGGRAVLVDAWCAAVLEHYCLDYTSALAWLLHRISLITNCLPPTALCNQDQDHCVQGF